MSEASFLSAVSFLPDNLKKNELYLEVAQGVDFALVPGENAAKEPLDYIMERLQLTYEDQEAATAYFNHFVKPVVGTRSALEFAFNLLNVEAKLIEWFEYEVPIPPYKFQITFDAFPGRLDFFSLITVIKTLKNERSFLSALRMVECADTLMLDYGYLSQDQLSATEGYIDPETNVLICLYQTHSFSLSTFLPHFHQHREDWYFQEYFHSVYPTLDNFGISLPWSPLYLNIIGTYSGVSDFCVQYFLGGETGLDVGRKVHPFYEVSITDRTWYRTATYQSQIVADDFGLLSDGLGFSGEFSELFVLDFSQSNSISNDLKLDQNLTLSQAASEPTPMLIFEWDYVSFEFLFEDFGEQVLQTEVHQYTQYLHYSASEFMLNETFLDAFTPFQKVLSTSFIGYSFQTSRHLCGFEIPLLEGSSWLNGAYWGGYDTWLTSISGLLHEVAITSRNPPFLSSMLLSEPFEEILKAEPKFAVDLPDISLTTISGYHTQTLESQVVPSDYGTLSEGVGLPGLFAELSDQKAAFPVLSHSFELGSVLDSSLPIFIAEYESFPAFEISSDIALRVGSFQYVYLNQGVSVRDLGFQLSSTELSTPEHFILATQQLGVDSRHIAVRLGFEVPLSEGATWSNFVWEHFLWAPDVYQAPRITYPPAISVSEGYLLSSPVDVSPVSISTEDFIPLDISLTTVTSYRTSTLESQVVPSEFGTLSEGIGLPGLFTGTATSIEQDPQLSQGFELGSVIDSSHLITVIEYQQFPLVLISDVLLVDVIAEQQEYRNQYLNVRDLGFQLSSTELSTPEHFILATQQLGVDSRHLVIRAAFEIPLSDGAEWGSRWEHFLWAPDLYQTPRTVYPDIGSISEGYTLSSPVEISPIAISTEDFLPLDISLTSVDLYRTSTFENQIVPSQFGILSDGMGFTALSLDMPTSFGLSESFLGEAPGIVDDFRTLYQGYGTTLIEDYIIPFSISSPLSQYTQYVSRSTDLQLSSSPLDTPSVFAKEFRSFQFATTHQFVEARSSFEIPFHFGESWSQTGWGDFGWTTTIAELQEDVQVKLTSDAISLSEGVLSDILQVGSGSIETSILGSLTISLTDISTYRTSTYQNQVVPSESAPLSQGFGTPSLEYDGDLSLALSHSLALSGEASSWSLVGISNYHELHQRVWTSSLEISLLTAFGITTLIIPEAQEARADFWRLEEYRQEYRLPDSTVVPFVRYGELYQDIFDVWEDSAGASSTHIYDDHLIPPDRHVAEFRLSRTAQQVTRSDYSFGVYPPPVWDAQFTYWPQDRDWAEFSYQPWVISVRRTFDLDVV